MQPLTWLACGWCLVRVAQTNDDRWWLGFGLAAGISLVSKYLIFFYLAGLAVGVISTPLRRSLLKPWLYLGALIALIFLAPSLYWQADNGWPFLALSEAGAGGKNLVLSPLAFVGQQLLFVGPASAPIWLAGLWRFTIRPAFPQLRVFPIAYGVMVALVYALHGKAYYLTPVYPVLLAGGALAIEGWLAGPTYRLVAAGMVGGAGVVTAPLALPILPPSHYASYAHALGISSQASATEKGAEGSLAPAACRYVRVARDGREGGAVYNALPPTSAPGQYSSVATTAKPPRLMSTVPRCTGRPRSAHKIIITFGDREGTTTR